MIDLRHVRAFGRARVYGTRDGIKKAAKREGLMVLVTWPFTQGGRVGHEVQLVGTTRLGMFTDESIGYAEMTPSQQRAIRQMREWAESEGA